MKRLALLLAVTACGREIHQTVDAAIVVEPDAPDTNGEPSATAVKLTITRLGVPVQGVVVVFQDPSSAVIATGKTDLTGRAWAEMPAGGFVTAVENTGMTTDELTTFATVVAGDALRLDHTPPATGTDLTVAFNLLQLDAGVNDGYIIHTSCGSGAADAAGAGLVELTQCGTSADIVVLSTLDGLPTGRGFHRSHLALPTAGEAVNLTGAFVPFTDVQLTYQNVPVEVQSIVGQEVLSATGRAYVASDSAVPAGGSATIPLAIPSTDTPLVTKVLTETTLYPTAGEFGQQQLFAWSAPATSVATDLGATMLPAFASAPIFDTGASAVTWTERSGGAEPHVVHTEISVHRDDIPEGHAWTWRLAGARGTATALAFPTLPKVMGFDFTPSEGDTIVVNDLTTARLPEGLAPWRTNVFAPLSTLITENPGSLVVQRLYSEPL